MSLTDHGRVRKQQFHDRLGILHHRTLHRKLKERFPAAFNTRWTRQHWLHASLFVTLGALLTAIVPGFSAQLQPTSQTSARCREVRACAWQSSATCRCAVINKIARC